MAKVKSASSREILWFVPLDFRPVCPRCIAGRASEQQSETVFSSPAARLSLALSARRQAGRRRCPSVGVAANLL